MNIWKRTPGGQTVSVPGYLFFANKSRHGEDRDAQMVPNDLDRRAASEDVHIVLHG